MLPHEVLRDIVIRAAYDPITAHSLAYVSRVVCKWTKVERWVTVVLTKSSSIELLARLLRDFDHTALISVPVNPASHTRNLYIESRDGYPASIGGEFLSHFTSVQVLSLGSAELRALGESVRLLAPISLSFVYDGEPSTIEHILAANSRLRHLHVVGVDPGNELAGVAMPIPQLERMCAGSITDESALALERAHVEYLRYDTRKFAFRPTDIVASRMYAFFQEPEIAAPELLDSQVAAMVRSQLHNIGCGGFNALEVNWHAAPSSYSASGNVRAQISRMTSAEYTGSWPLELRGAWTDQTSGHRSSADAFRAEFIESITGLYGWEPRPAQLAEWMHYDGQYIDRIMEGFTENERLRLDELYAAISDRIGTGEFQLRYRARVPAHFLRLGEQYAALLPEDRLSLFYARTSLNSTTSPGG